MHLTRHSRRLRVLAAATAAALVGGAAQGAPVLWSTASGGNGHYYEYVESTQSFDGALAAADAAVLAGYDSYLATITTEGENAFIASITTAFGAPTPVWVAGSDEETEGVWKWVAGPEAGTVFWSGGPGGSTTTFAAWSSGLEPNNNGNEDGLAAFWAGTTRWNDLAQNGDGIGYVIEYSRTATGPVPEPSTWALLIAGFGLVGAALRGARTSRRPSSVALGVGT